MKILVIGSEGFIGSHLGRELQDSGHQVGNMDVALGPKGDARKLNNVLAAIDAHKAEVVIHLAANINQETGEDDVFETVSDHAGMTTVVAKACGQTGARLVYASAAGIYGDVGAAECHETKGPFALPHNAYGLNKRFAESLCRLYAPNGFTALRISMPYGPGAAVGRGGSAVANLLWQARHGNPMPVHVGAERSWCWIGDTVRAIRLSVEHGEGPYNVGRDDDQRTVRYVAELACSLTGADKNLILMVPVPGRQTAVRRLSSSRIKQLGWTPKVSLYDGMATTLATWVSRLDDTGSLSEPVLEAV